MFLEWKDYKVDEKKSVIQERVTDAIWQLIALWAIYNKRYNLFKTWETLWKDEWWEVKTNLNFFRRFVKAHASYTLKDRPNIQCPAEHPDQYESKELAALKERVLNLWRDSNNFVKKLKTASIRAAVFWDQYLFVYYNPEKERIDIKIFDPLELYYETIEEDPDSEIKYFVRVALYDVDYLKQKYPKYKKDIIPTSGVIWLQSINNFLTSRFNSPTKALVSYYVDKEYIYTIINDNLIVDKKKHWYWFIPLIHWRYIDVWEKYGESVIDIIEETVKYVHLSLSYLLTTLSRFSNTPLVTNVDIPDIEWQLKKWLLVLPDGNIQYLQVPPAPTDLYNVINLGKTFMHFISWLSEEAMAWFTWALTAAGVAIELRLDSTVREALDCQIVLKSVLEKMNRMWLKLMESKLKNKNLLEVPEIWVIDHIQEFLWSFINWNYYNIVDFGGILPRSEAQIVQNVLSKYKMWLISQDTALEELRYVDPSLEKTKIVNEKVEMYKLQKALEKWEVEKIWWLKGPKDEDLYMIQNKIVAPVYPEQDHLAHYMEHKKTYEATQNPVILLHMQAHQSYLEQWLWWPASVEQTEEKVSQAYQQPLTEEEALLQQQAQNNIPSQL